MLTGNYDIQDRLDANKYTVDARKTILDIIDKGKLPIVEGGSWFYIKHLFTGICDAYEREDIHKEAKTLAKKVIAKDKSDFVMALSRFQTLADQVDFND